MKFEQVLLEGRLLKRYKRFLVDVELPGGEVITAHTSNTGAMTGCSTPGSRVWLSKSSNLKRKYPYTWEIIQISDDVHCGINTILSNYLVKEAIENGVVDELKAYTRIRREVPYGQERSRIDLLLESDELPLLPRCYVEVKNVTLAEDGVAYFPDAVTVRGTKHLRELISVVQSGDRAVIFYCVQRSDCSEMRIADTIDAEYGRVFKAALSAGVEALAYSVSVKPTEIMLTNRLPVIS